MRIIFFGILCACTLALTSIEQTDAVKGLIGRVLGEVGAVIFSDNQEYIELFDLEIVEKENVHRDYWIIGETTTEGHIPIRGTTGVAISNGLYMQGQLFHVSFMNRYMKYYSNSTLSWGEDGTGDNVKVPIPLPRVTKV